MTTETTSSLGDEADAADAPKKANLRRFIPLVVIAAIAAGYGGFNLYQRTRPYEWSGTVEARTITVGSRTGGRVKEVLVHEGDKVTAGQPLVVLELGDLTAQRLMAAGALEEAQAALDKTMKGARPEEIEAAKARAATATSALEESKAGARSEEIAGANARLVQAQVAADKAQVDASRAHKLVASGSIAQAEADNYDSALKGAIAQRDSLQQALDQLKNGVRVEEISQARTRAIEAQASMKLVEAGSRIEDIKAAQGAVDAAKGRLDSIDVMIGELTIVSPNAARVESLDLRPGDILAPSAAAATVLEDDQLYVRIYVPETRIGLIHLGAEVPISVDSFPNRTFKGVVEHINTVGEYSPRNLQTADERADQVFATRIGVRQGIDELRAGMAAFITVPK
ncbi:MAG: efflux RND transporter periplasmic adaptor subunit [Polyangiaceae bacterium]